MPFRPSLALPLLALSATFAAPLPGQRNDAANAPFRAPVRIGTLPAKVLPEASGLARSRRHPGVFWTLNDSDAPAEVFAVRLDGTVLRRVAVPGARNVDWEDLAIDAENRLVVGDLGDNFGAHEEHALYRFAEPDPTGAAAVPRVETFRFHYPAGTGRVDAEALFVAGDTAFVVTKEAHTARVFRIALTGAGEPGTPPVEAEAIGDLEGLQRVTGACLSDDGRHLALLTYSGVVVFDFAEALRAAAPAADLQKVLQKAERREQAMVLGQCEGIAFDGADLVVATEKGPFAWGVPVLWRIVPK